MKRHRLPSASRKKRIKCKGCGYVSYVYKFDLLRHLAYCVRCHTIFTWEKK
jgi:uncharacterized paraquat-inducible protein A